MLTYQEKTKVSNILDEVLGGHIPLKENEHVHHCPICPIPHHKKKLNINLENQKWHCWVCDAKGKSIYYLLKILKANKSILTQINKIYSAEYFVYTPIEEIPEQILLPKEFISLSIIPKGFHPSFKRAISYIKRRGITNEDIIKHNIGFCSTGTYAGRIIIPSYTEKGILNYFIARTIFEEENFKYKNPKISKDIIAFGNQINWNKPIVIVEGIFDAITIKRNVIPIFGKFIPKKLMREIFIREVNKIYIMLDQDAQQQALYYVEYFQNQGINCINIFPSDKDASQMGFEHVTNVIKETKQTSFEDIITQKLNFS